MRTALMRHLTELTRKDVKFKWRKEEQVAFDKLKAEVANAILITYPDPGNSFTYYPDASQEYACGRLLLTVKQSINQPILSSP